MPFGGVEPWEHLEVTAVYWDAEAERPSARQINTAPLGTAEGYAALVADYRPCLWYDLPALALAQTFPAWDTAWTSLASVSDEHRFKVRDVAPAIVNAQRETAGTVAGWVDMAAVTARGGLAR